VDFLGSVSVMPSCRRGIVTCRPVALDSKYPARCVRIGAQHRPCLFVKRILDRVFKTRSTQFLLHHLAYLVVVLV
jgi:hypothetical protein